MKLAQTAILSLTLGSSVALAQDCTAPTAPQLPDGASSTMEQMLEGQKAVKTYQAANLEYMKCLEPMLAAAEAELKEGVEGAAEKYKQVEDSYNSAVSAEEEVAGQFNTEIREYKAANPN